MNKVKAVVFGVMMSAAIAANAADEATTVTGEVGKDVKLPLESSPVTGYDWMIKGLPDELIFVSRGHKQSKDCPKGAVECGGGKVLHLIGEEKEGSTLRLIYGRSFGKSN